MKNKIWTNKINKYRHRKLTKRGSKPQ